MTDTSSGNFFRSIKNFNFKHFDALIFFFFNFRNGDNKISVKDDFRKLISELSLSCEKIIHGTPSGIDHNTILHGSMLEFVKSESGNKMTRIESGTINILLVNTNVSRSTKAQVEKVKELKTRHSGIIDNVLEAMGHVSKSAIEVLKDLKTKPTELNALETKLSVSFLNL